MGSSSSSKKKLALSSVRRLTHQLISRSMPRDILRLSPFDPAIYTRSIRSEVDGLRLRKVKKATQLETLRQVMEKPFGRPYVYIIASGPHDGKAKLTAAVIMENAVKQQLKGFGPRGRTLPLWHTVNGSFQDSLRDGDEDKPSLLILSNIAVDSTAVKIEKVRDLLEQYNNIPRIVVMTGTDPVSFSNNRLRMPINFCLNLATGYREEL